MVTIGHGQFASLVAKFHNSLSCLTTLHRLCTSSRPPCDANPCPSVKLYWIQCTAWWWKFAFPWGLALLNCKCCTKDFPDFEYIRWDPFPLLQICSCTAVKIRQQLPRQLRTIKTPPSIVDFNLFQTQANHITILSNIVSSKIRINTMSSPRSSTSSAGSSDAAPYTPKVHTVRRVCYPTGKWYDCLRPTTQPYKGCGGMTTFAEVIDARNTEVEVGSEEAWHHDIHAMSRGMKSQKSSIQSWATKQVDRRLGFYLCMHAC